MVRRRNLDRSSARQVKHKRLEWSHVTHLLNVFDLHADVLPPRCEWCNLADAVAPRRMVTLRPMILELTLPPSALRPRALRFTALAIIHRA